MVEMVRNLGLAWVAIGYAWQNADGSTKRFAINEIPAYAAALRRAGIKVWLWAWPEPGRATELADGYRELARRAKIEGLILDPEKPYQGVSVERAREDMEIWKRLRVPIGVTTYGAPPSWHPRFPWGAFVSADFGLPQLYDTKHKWGAEHQRRTFDGWRELGITVLVPIWGASNAHSPGQMREEIRQTPREYKGAAWWDFYWLQQSAARRKVVAAFKIGGRVS